MPEARTRERLWNMDAYGRVAVWGLPAVIPDLGSVLVENLPSELGRRVYALTRLLCDVEPLLGEGAS